MALRTVVMVWIPVGLLALIGIAIVVGPIRGSVAEAPAVPVAEPVAVRHVDGDPDAARRRSQPAAVIASELVVPWSTIRTAVAGRASDDDSAALAEELGDVVETLRRT